MSTRPTHGRRPARLGVGCGKPPPRVGSAARSGPVPAPPPSRPRPGARPTSEGEPEGGRENRREGGKTEGREGGPGREPGPARRAAPERSAAAPRRPWSRPRSRPPPPPAHGSAVAVAALPGRAGRRLPGRVSPHRYGRALRRAAAGRGGQPGEHPLPGIYGDAGHLGGCWTTRRVLGTRGGGLCAPREVLLCAAVPSRGMLCAPWVILDVHARWC